MQTKPDALVTIVHGFVKKFMADAEEAAREFNIPIHPLVTTPTCKNENETRP
jgi:hypothetical protein